MLKSIKTTVHIIAFLSITIGTAFAGQARIKIVTGELPPYSFKENGGVSGIAAGIVQEIMTRTGFTQNIIIRPWSRAIHLSTGNDRMTFPLARLPYREDQYRWVGPILNDKLVFVVPATDTSDYNTPNDFKHLKVGVIKGAPPASRLGKAGFTKLQIVTDEGTNAKKILAGRLDAWYTSHLIMRDTFKKMGIDESKIKVVLSDLDITMYVGASKNLEKAAGKWQEALDNMKSDGTFQKLLKTFDAGPDS